MSARDVLMVGGGIIGLTAAWKLAGDGARVTVVERASPGSGASSCSAGMLAGQMESTGNPTAQRLACRSRDMWPELAARLQEESGVNVEIVMNGILRAAVTEAEARHWQVVAHWQTVAGQPAQWLNAKEMAELVPGIGPVVGGLLAENEGQINPPRVMAALISACQRRGVELRTGTPVTGWLKEGDRVVGVRTPGGDLTAGVTVLTAGNDSGLLAQLALESGTPPAAGGEGHPVDAGSLALPVGPVKGQICSLLPGPGMRGPWLEAAVPIYAPGVYLVPRRNGRILIGATKEVGVEDTRTTVHAILQLAGAATALIPSLGEATLEDMWAGLRPGTPDGLPAIGWWRPGLLVAAGHHRLGVTLTPITAELIAALLQDRAPAEDLAPYTPGRFRTQGST